MSYVCPLCRELLTAPVTISPGKNLEDYHIVATFCGHMFHKQCLIYWLGSQKVIEVQRTCPVCNINLKEGDIVRMFPKGGEAFIDYSTLANAINQSTPEVDEATKNLKETNFHLYVIMELSFMRQRRIAQQSKQLYDLQVQIQNLQKEKDSREAERKSKWNEFGKIKRKYNKYKSILEMQTLAAQQAVGVGKSLIKTVKALKVYTEGNKEEENADLKFSNDSSAIGKLGEKFLSHAFEDKETKPELEADFGQDDLPRIIIPKIMFGILSGVESKNMATSYVQVIQVQRDVHQRCEIIIYFPRGATFFPSLELFQLQMMTFLRICRIPYRREVVDTQEKTLPIMKIAETIIYEPEVCGDVLTSLFAIEKKSRSTNPFEIDTRMINLWSIFATRVIWGVFLWQWEYDNGIAMEIVPEWTARVAAAVKSKVMQTAFHETYGSVTVDTVSGIVVEDIKTLSRELGDRKYFNGNYPEEIDCTGFVLLSQIMWNSPRSDFQEELSKHENLINFVHRMKDRFWPDWRFGAALPKQFI